MSRTIRKNKWGETVRDGDRYKCRCAWCMGETRRKVEKEVYDREIKDTIDLFYGDIPWNEDQIWNRFDAYYYEYCYSTTEEDINWWNYQEAA